MPTSFTPYLKTVLCQQLYKVYAKPLVTDKDYDGLVDAIQNKVGDTISKSTLKRWLSEKVSNNHKAYQNTLNILTLYTTGLTYTEWHKEYTIEEVLPENHFLVPDENGIQLLDLCMLNENYDVVYQYLQKLPCNELDGQVDSALRYNIARMLGKHFRNSSKAQKTLLPSLALLPQGRFFFFQKFVDLDHLTGYFGNGMLKYKQHTPKSSTLYEKDNCFADSLLFWEEVLKGNHKQIKRKGFELFHNVDFKEINPTISNSAIPLFRWHNNRLIYLYYANKLNTQTIEETIHLCEQMLTNTGEQLHFCTQLFMCLLITKNEHLIFPIYLKYEKQIRQDLIPYIETPAFFLIPKMVLFEQGQYELANTITIPSGLSFSSDFKSFMGKIDLQNIANN